MGRIIKFRAWYKPEGKMYHWGSGVTAIDHQLNVETVPAGRTLKHDKVELMQFTGMLDCDGKEIYEGDIVAFGSLKIEVKFGLFCASNLSIVDGYEWEDAGRAMAWSINADDASRGEILGNIYDNPELLEKGGE